MLMSAVTVCVRVSASLSSVLTRLSVFIATSVSRSFLYVAMSCWCFALSVTSRSQRASIGCLFFSTFRNCGAYILWSIVISSSFFEKNPESLSDMSESTIHGTAAESSGRSSKAFSFAAMKYLESETRMTAASCESIAMSFTIVSIS